MTKLENEFIAYLNDFHSYQEPRDPKLDAWLHESYAEAIRKGMNVDWNYIYFSPSSADSCPRELYVKAKKKRKDKTRHKPHQRRWTAQGTALGDWLQREILLAERHYEKFSGNKPRFVFGMVNEKPAFEDFVFKQHKMTWKGEELSILGTTDGIMIDTKTGEKIGLEIKSKQETPSKTSLSGMKEPNPKHVKQVVSYGEMYGIERFLIVYVNAAKKKWFATDDELENTPDIRAFEVKITDDMREAVFDYYAYITKCVRENNPPKLDLDKWRFNSFKKACANDLSDEELADIELEVASMTVSNLPGWKIRQANEALEEIRELRGDS